MVTTLPQFIRTIDNAFTTTWYEIQPQAENQILDATVLTAWLKQKGCFRTQEGGDTITRTVKYALPTTQAVVKGDTMEGQETERRTMGIWTFRNLSTTMTRSLHDDRANRGKFKIVDYVADKTQDHMEALRQQYEDDFLAANASTYSAESGKNIQSLVDMIPLNANKATGTYGNIARSNDWWQPKYQQLTVNPEINLLTDMKNFKNDVEIQRETVDGILTTQALYELYEEFGLDAVQIVGNQKLLDLGFTTLKFKGADMFWSSNVLAASETTSGNGDMFFLTSKYIEVTYDPMVWFSMGQWKEAINQVERQCHILCCCNMVPGPRAKVALRHHGRLYT